MAHEKIWTCPHCNTAQIQLGPGDPHGLNKPPVRQFEEYVCFKCGNRMTPPGGLPGENGARNIAAPGSELSADGKLLSIACPNFSHLATGTATITLDGAAKDGGLTVTLTSSDEAKMTIPASVVVAGGATTATVTVTGVGAGASTLTASATGSVNKTVVATAT